MRFKVEEFREPNYFLLKRLSFFCTHGEQIWIKVEKLKIGDYRYFGTADFHYTRFLSGKYENGKEFYYLYSGNWAGSYTENQNHGKKIYQALAEGFHEINLEKERQKRQSDFWSSVDK